MPVFSRGSGLGDAWGLIVSVRLLQVAAVRVVEDVDVAHMSGSRIVGVVPVVDVKPFAVTVALL